MNEKLEDRIEELEKENKLLKETLVAIIEQIGEELEVLDLTPEQVDLVIKLQDEYFREDENIYF